MIVAADSGPPHYLILLEQIDLLRRFYGQVKYPSRRTVTRSSREGFAVDRTTGQRRSATQERSRIAAQHNSHPFSWRRSR